MARIEIDQVRKAYRQWRGKGQRAVPLELRRAILELSKRHGERTVIRELGVSSMSLWQWRRNVRKTAKGLRASAKNVRPVEFVEVTPVPRSGASSGIRVEWQRSDGHTMREEGCGFDEVGLLATRFIYGAGDGK